MEVSLTPDTYTPLIDNNVYTDTFNFTFPKSGLKCGCGSNTTFTDMSKFKTHTKGKKHNKWLEEMTKNNGNYYNQLQKAERTTREQQKIIANKDKKIIELETIIQYLKKENDNKVFNMMKLD
tara:strand:+ start:140 stop:505 length:366 start_codon:yes stop_codon:yes gene_type:complete